MYQPNTVGKKSSVKKETQILHHLVDPIEGSQEDNNKSLLETAMRLSTTRIVVKRPLKSPPLANAKPHSCVEGSTQRFDLYFMNQKITFL
jgi:16S rRNA (guanine1516-N2)-methyltransferase